MRIRNEERDVMFCPLIYIKAGRAANLALVVREPTV